MKCINCGAGQNGKFCSNCGQPLEVKRVTLRDAWSDVWEHVSGFDGKLARTFKDLTIRPGFVSREFINGNRLRYYGPVAYYLLMITVFILWLSVINLDYVSYIKSLQETITAEKDNQFTNSIRQGISDNLKIFAFFIVPFIAFASRRIFFREQSLNFLEHSVPVFYMLGHWYWLQMIEATVYRYTAHSGESIWRSLALGIYFGFGYTTFVTNQSKVKVFLKGVGVYFSGLLFFIILMAIVVVVSIVFLLNVDPSQLDSIRPSKAH